jgi:hypothetical protein
MVRLSQGYTFLFMVAWPYHLGPEMKTNIVVEKNACCKMADRKARGQG